MQAAPDRLVQCQAKDCMHTGVCASNWMQASEPRGQASAALPVRGNGIHFASVLLVYIFPSLCFPGYIAGEVLFCIDGKVSGCSEGSYDAFSSVVMTAILL